MSENSRLIVVILHVADLARSLTFYREGVGIPLVPGHNEPDDDAWYGGHHAELSWRAGAYLHFALFPSRPFQHRVTTGAEIGFNVESLAPIHERLLRCGAVVLHAPRTEPWGTTSRYLDPDGNVVGLTER